MPLLKKVIRGAKSDYITLPKSWIEYITEKEGRSFEFVEVEVNGELRIRPFFKDKATTGEAEG